MPKALRDYVSEALESVREVEPDDLASLPGYVLLDVREPDEFAAGRIPGSRNVPRGFLEVRVDLEHPKRDETLADRNLKFVCICGGGHRSALAAKTLQEMGFAEAVSLAGGWSRWTAEGRPVEEGT